MLESYTAGLATKNSVRTPVPKNREQRSPYSSVRANNSSRKKLNQNQSGEVNLNQTEIYEKLNQALIREQDKDIEIERLQTTCKSLNVKSLVIDELMVEIEGLKQQIRDKDVLISKSSEVSQTLKQGLKILSDENDMLKQHILNLESNLRASLDGKLKMQAQFEDMTEYILQMEEKVYKSNKISLELLKQLKDAESEIAMLQGHIRKMSTQVAIYVPVKDDAIDRQLAEYINNYPERHNLKVMFMRESEGVYTFGSKRISIKIEQNGIKIRVGGGYLSIDEFIDQYTPTETEKIERKSPVKKLVDKLAV